MIEILIPAALRSFTDGKSAVEVGSNAAATVGDALDRLTEQYPEIKKQISEPDGSIRNFINVFAGDTNIKDLQGADTAVKDGDTVMLGPAIAGGK
jgi:adenylyltransferase/sulfurtransferase